MRKTWKKLCSILTAAVVFTASFSDYSAGMVKAADDSTSKYELAANVQDGVMLQCFGWSYNTIADNMEKIAESGYTSIQTSPIQQAVKQTAGLKASNWYWLYQPINFSIDDSGKSALGTKSEFTAMCSKAHEYGVKVIVDIIPNHLASGSANKPNSLCLADLKDDSTCWHNTTKLTNYENRMNLTQYCSGGLPDLNTGSEKVQNYTINFMKECIDCGTDGFRFDSAKHIETPLDDAAYKSDFWPNVITAATEYAKSAKNIDLFCYGEILNKPYTDIKGYTEYINVTDTGYSEPIRSSVGKMNEALSIESNTYSYPKENNYGRYPIVWAESHDTWANADGASRNTDISVINKTWAIVCARADATPLYYARPSSLTTTSMGDASDTGWSFDEVSKVNAFHNRFIGKGDYVSSDWDSTVYVERGKKGTDTGVTIINCKGEASSVNQKMYLMNDGLYTDQISGNTFKVTNGILTGKTGANGIAVIYNKNAGDGLNLKSFSASVGSGKIVANNTITLNAKASGEGLTYKFVSKLGSTTKVISNYSTKSSVKWKPLKAGTYTLTVYVKSKAGTLTKQIKYSVKAALSVSSVKVSGTKHIAGKKLTVSAKAAGGIGTIKYSYSYIFNKKEKVIKSYSTAKAVKFTPSKAGTYKIKVSARDSKGTVKTKTISCKVVKK